MMKAKSLIVVSVGILGPLLLSSCDTPVGQGAAWGAATGAIIGGAATGHVRAASIGAAAGAAAGALTGAIIQENQAARYGPPPPGGFPYARWAGTPGFYYSPYTGRVYDLRGVPPGGLTRDVDTGRLFRKP
jgi:Glycine zipper